MKMFQSIKNDPKKKSIAIGILATLILIAIIQYFVTKS